MSFWKPAVAGPHATPTLYGGAPSGFQSAHGLLWTVYG